jgi:hypothetical protein
MKEFRAARACLATVRPEELGRGQFFRVMADDVAATLAELEGTYFLRMTAESERAMRLHLATHFAHVRITSRDGFGRLLNRCATNFDPSQPGVRMPRHLLSDAKTLTDYRNDQAHSLRLGFNFPRIDTARVKLSRFLYALPPI